MKIVNLSIVLLLVVWLSGCATMSHGTTQEVSISSNPQGVEFEVSPSGQLGVTPSIVTLSRAHDHVVTFKVDEDKTKKYHIGRTYARKTINGAYIPFVGLALVGVDAMNGAQFTLHPKELHAEFSDMGAIQKDSKYSEVYFYNANNSSTPIHIKVNDEASCKLKKHEYLKRSLLKGTQKIRLHFFDLFKFEDEFTISVDEPLTNIAVYNASFSTHLSYANERPSDFKEACQKLVEQEKVEDSL